jgi:hypothetical protein
MYKNVHKRTQSSKEDRTTTKNTKHKQPSTKKYQKEQYINPNNIKTPQKPHSTKNEQKKLHEKKMIPIFLNFKKHKHNLVKKIVLEIKNFRHKHL